MTTRRNNGSPLPIGIISGLTLLLAACGDSILPDSSGSKPSTYIVGGTVAGIGEHAPVALSINGNAPVSLNEDGVFAFKDKPLAADEPYAVTATAASGHDCTIVNGSGFVAAAPIDNIEVLCQPIAAPSAFATLITRIAAMQLETDDLALLDAEYLNGGYTAETLHAPASFSTEDAIALTMGTPETAPLPANWFQVFTFTLDAAQRVHFDLNLPFHTSWHLYNSDKVRLRNLTDCFYSSFCSDAPDSEYPPYLHAMNLDLAAGTYYIVGNNLSGGTKDDATYTLTISDGTGQAVSPLYPNISSPAMAPSPGTGLYDVAFDTGTNASNRTRAIIRRWRLTNGVFALMGDQKLFSVWGFGTSLEIEVMSNAGVVTDHPRYEANLNSVRGLDLISVQASVPEDSDLEFRHFDPSSQTEENHSAISLTCQGTPGNGRTCYLSPYYLAVKRTVDIPRPTTIRISAVTPGDVVNRQELHASWHWPRSGTLSHGLTATGPAQSWSGWRSGPMVSGLAEIYGFLKNSGGKEVYDFLPGAAGSLELGDTEVETYGGIMQTSEIVRPDTYWHFARSFYVNSNPPTSLASSAVELQKTASASAKVTGVLPQPIRRLPGGAFRMAIDEMAPQRAQP